jgi:hypothetical protein
MLWNSTLKVNIRSIPSPQQHPSPGLDWFLFGLAQAQLFDGIADLKQGHVKPLRDDGLAEPGT